MLERYKPALRKFLSYSKLVFEFLLVVVFVTYGVWHWPEIRIVTQRVSPLTLIVCMCIYTLSHFLAAATAQALFAASGYQLRYTTFLSIHLQRLPAKYLPGGVWQTVGRGTDLARLGIPGRAVMKTLLLEQSLAIWWAGIIGFSLVGTTFTGNARHVALAIAFALLAGASVLSLLVRPKKNLAQLAHAALSPKACAGYVLGWLCLASAFTCYVLASGITQAGPLRIGASYLTSWMLGALAFFAPQGMGVFELVMRHAILPSRPGNVGALWLIGSYRLVVLSADLLIWIAWSIWRRIAPPPNNTR